MSSVRKSAALNALEELSLLPALGSQGLPALRATLSDLLPVDGVSVSPTDTYGFCVGFQGDEVFTPTMARCFFESYYDTPSEDHLGPNCRLLFRHGERIFPTSRGPKHWRSSDCFQDVFAAFGVQHTVRLLFKQGRRAVGLLLLARVDGADFTPTELSLLLDLHASIGHVVDSMCRPVVDGALVPDGEATWIFTPDGTIEAASLGATNVARLAYDDDLGLAAPDTMVEAAIGHSFAALRDRLNRGESATLSHRSRFGQFEFSASWLEARGANPGRRVKVGLVHQVPLQTRLFLSPRFRALPRREKQTVLMLSEGHSTKTLAERAGVAESTALSWVRSLYARFGIRRRHELVQALLTQSAV